MSKNLVQDQIDENTEFIQQWLDKVFPVGSIYMNMNNIDPSSIFGGKWIRIPEKFLFGSGDNYSNGSTGGEVSHILSTNELPSHAHGEQLMVHGYDGWNSFTTSGYGVVISYNQGNNYFGPNQTMHAAATAAFTNTGRTGGGQAHNNMPPYLVVSMWYRAA